jgi:Fe-S oxidoreductase
MGLFSVFGKSANLYFPGCTTYFKNKDIFKLYKDIFDKLGIDFRVIDKKVCCGLPALEAGYENEARKLAKRNFEIFKEEGIKTIITNSPCCYKMLLQNYSEILPDWNIEIKNIWQIILEKLEEKPRLIKSKSDEIVTYQDSCYLGRYCNIYNEPRKILELIGYKIKEMNDSKENAFCCGSCGGLDRVNPELADKIAKERILQAKRIGVKKIIVNSVKDYELMKKNTGDSRIEIIEFSEALADALGIPREKDTENKINREVEKIIGETRENDSRSSNDEEEDEDEGENNEKFCYASYR